jgi:uncharacterized protein YeaO (DUF488 family)
VSIAYNSFTAARSTRVLGSFFDHVADFHLPSRTLQLLTVFIMLTISTSRITYRGTNKLDITIKSSKSLEEKMFAPTWDMVMGVKKYHGDTRFPNIKPISSDEYDERYYQLLRERYAKNKQVFIDLIHRDSVVLCCYCSGHPTHCHRHLASDILHKIAEHGVFCISPRKGIF